MFSIQYYDNFISIKIEKAILKEFETVFNWKKSTQEKYRKELEQAIFQVTNFN